MSICLTGRLVRKQSFGDWAIGVFRTEAGEQHKVVGATIASLEGDRDYELTGEMKQHPKYGEQLEVSIAVPHIKPNRNALLRHLERNFKGVGPKTAEQIVAWHEENATLEELRQKLVYRPWELQNFETAGSRRGIQFKHQAATTYSYLYTQLATRHCTTGVPDSVLRRVAKWLVEKVGEDASDPIGESLTRFCADPYEPMLEVWGYGFAHADAIGGELGIAKGAPCRLAALVYHTLKTATEGDGHTFLPLDVLSDRVHSIDPRVDVRIALNYVPQKGYPIVVDDKRRCYPDRLCATEGAVAEMLATLLLPSPPIRVDANEELLIGELRTAQAKVKTGFELDESQRKAVLGLLFAKKRLHTLTAGPGCGKTSIMEVFAQLALGKVKFCAPTGKAAKVLHARVARHGFNATTIHQLLEPSAMGFERNEDRPIEADIVVVDEGSMVDLMLLYHLLIALPPTAHLVLVGDKDQLPSVGAGNVLADVLKMPADHHTLNVTHRNQGAILALVQELREGRFASPGSDFAGDVLHLPMADDEPATFSLVEETYLDAIRRVGVQHTGLLVPMRKGRRDTPGWNTTYLNARLQSVLNPGGQPIRGTEFRVGDRVIFRRNMALPHGGVVKTVVNGDTGTVLSQDTNDEGMPRTCAIQLDDTRVITLPAELLDLVTLAYAMTVHAAQGSEYHTSIVLMNNGSPAFLHRRVLYTAASRAREALILFGQMPVLSAIAKRPGPARYSALAEKVLQEHHAC